MRNSIGSYLARGFTLIELIAVIVVLAILSGVAIPRYIDYTARARESAMRGNLGSVRSALSNYAGWLSLQGTPGFPTLADLTTIGRVLQEPIPSNPYKTGTGVTDATRRQVRAADWNPANPTVFPVSSDPEGWNYDATDGKFWPNSNTIGENAW